MWPRGREHEDSWHQSQETGLSRVPQILQRDVALPTPGFSDSGLRRYERIHVCSEPPGSWAVTAAPGNSERGTGRGSIGEQAGGEKEKTQADM